MNSNNIASRINPASITGGKLRSHAEGGAQLASRRNCLNALLVFKGALIVIIGQAPARLHTEKWSAIGPQGHVRHAAKIQSHPSASRRIDIGKISSGNINQFKNDRAGQFVL